MTTKLTEDLIKRIFKLTNPVLMTIKTNKNQDVVSEIVINNITIDLILSNCTDTQVLFMMLPQENFKKLLELTPEFRDYYYNLADDAFVNEFKYKKGDVQRVIENIKNDLDIDAEATNFINIYFDSTSGELVSSIFSDVCYPSNQNNPTVYFWSLFTNPKYYRKGFAESLIKLITSTNVNIIDQYQSKAVEDDDDYKSPYFTALAYVWNTPSINLFTKLGYVCTHTITPENTSENQKTLKKYKFKDVEYTEDVQLHFIYDPSRELDHTIDTIEKTNNNTDVKYDNIEKIE
jgi:hypothetical protein